MDWQRTLLIFGMGMIAWLLVIQWNQFQEDQPKSESSYNQVEVDRSENAEIVGLQERAYISQAAGDLPQLESMPTLDVAPTPLQRQLVTAKNDVLEITIDTLGGDIVNAVLLQHFDRKADEGGKALPILQNTRENLYVARSGLIGPNATDTNEGRPQFAAAFDNYILNADKEKLTIDLTINIDGVRIGTKLSIRYLNGPRAGVVAKFWFQKTTNDRHFEVDGYKSVGTDSPLGEALEGAHVDDTVSFDVRDQEIRVQVTELKQA